MEEIKKCKYRWKLVLEDGGDVGISRRFDDCIGIG